VGGPGTRCQITQPRASPATPKPRRRSGRPGNRVQPLQKPASTRPGRDAEGPWPPAEVIQGGDDHAPYTRGAVGQQPQLAIRLERGLSTMTPRCVRASGSSNFGESSSRNSPGLGIGAGIDPCRPYPPGSHSGADSRQTGRIERQARAHRSITRDLEVPPSWG